MSEDKTPASLVTHGPIVGATTATSVTIWLRASAHTEATIRLAESPADLDQAFVQEKNLSLEEGSDYSGAVTFEGLQPDQIYYYAVLLQELPVLPDAQFKELSFRTFPAVDDRQSFSFAFGSCFRPHFAPVQPDGTRVPISDPIFDLLAPGALAADPRFFCMIGDNVYVDDYYNRMLRDDSAPAGQTLQQFYRAAYRDSWQLPRFRAALMKTPTFMIFDDHEFWDNWGNRPAHRYDEEGFPVATSVYREYQDSHNPDASDRHRAMPEQYYYTFTYSDAAFFVLDCRTRRNPTALPYPTMIGREQREALYAWLIENKDRYALKFIISSVPVTFIALPHAIINHLHGGLGDQWHGYPEERLALFHVIQQERISGVHFLSGDIHLGQGVVVKPDDPTAPDVYCYTASPLANTFRLAPQEAPTWSSAVLGGVVGALAGLILSLATGDFGLQAGLFWGLILGALAAELLRRLLGRFQPPEQEKQAGVLGRAFYRVLSNLAQNTYLKRLLHVADDSIYGPGVAYRPQNLFSPLFHINLGLITVTRDGEKFQVKFELLDERGSTCREHEHTV